MTEADDELAEVVGGDLRRIGGAAQKSIELAHRLSDEGDGAFRKAFGAGHQAVALEQVREGHIF
jgi:hypothetical protein